MSKREIIPSLITTPEKLAIRHHESDWYYLRANNLRTKRRYKERGARPTISAPIAVKVSKLISNKPVSFIGNLFPAGQF